MTTLQDLLVYKKIAGGGGGGGGEAVLINKDISANGTYYASTDHADGYKKVVVGVLPNVGTKSISENGTYNAASENLDGFSSVTVDVEPDLTTKSITENGTYTAAAENKDGFSSVEVNVAGATLTTKSITANGTYNASSDNADGYSSVTVNVYQPNPQEDLDKFFAQTLTYYKNNTGSIPSCPFMISGMQDSQVKNLVFWSTRENIIPTQTRHFQQAISLKYCNLGKISDINPYSFYLTGNQNLKAVIILYSGVPALANTNAFSQSPIANGTGFVYVPDSLVNDYKVASNWSTYANQIKGFSEASAYDATTTYSIGDVCKYNGKFYGYCKKDLTSSTGNAPSGTTSDNDYWEYVADIEVV